MIEIYKKLPGHQKFISVMLIIIFLFSPLLSSWRVEYRGGIIIFFSLLLLIILSVINFNRTKKIELHKLIFSCFILTLLISILFSSEKELSLIWTAYYVGWFAVFWAAQSTRFARKLFLFIFTLSLFLVFLYCWWQYYEIFPATIKYFQQHPELTGIFSNTVLKPRLYGSFQYPNALASFIILSTGIILTSLLSEKNRKLNWSLLLHSPVNWWLIILFGGCSFFIWLTASRAGIIIWMVQVTIIVLLFLKTHLKLSAILLTLAVICSSWSLLSTDRGNENYSAETITTRTIEISKTAASKLLTFKGSVNMIKHHPWFGVGAGLFGHNYYRYRPQSQTDAPNSAHNLFLDITAQTGIFSGMLLFILLFLILKSCLNNKIIFIVLCSVLLHSMVDWNFNIIGIGFSFFILAGLYCMPKYISVPKPAIFVLTGVKIISILLAALGLYFLARSTIGGFLFMSAHQNHKFQNWRIAREQYHQAIKVNPLRAEYYLHFSFVQTDLHRAEDNLLRAKDLAPFWYEPYYNLARINYLQNNNAAALLFSDSALQLFPSSGEVRALTDSIHSNISK